MTDTAAPRVVINFREDGCFEVMTDEPCEVYSVCECAPHDRVYRLTESHMVSRAAVDAALRDDTIGHSGDERHDAIKNRVLSDLSGKPHLRPIE